MFNQYQGDRDIGDLKPIFTLFLTKIERLNPLSRSSKRGLS